LLFVGRLGPCFVMLEASSGQRVVATLPTIDSAS
jgi:hypothetical protein